MTPSDSSPGSASTGTQDQPPNRNDPRRSCTLNPYTNPNHGQMGGRARVPRRAAAEESAHHKPKEEGSEKGRRDGAHRRLEIRDRRRRAAGEDACDGQGRRGRETAEWEGVREKERGFWRGWSVGQMDSGKPCPCSLGLSATGQQCFSLRTNQPPATSCNQPAVLFSQNKPAPAISHQPTEQAACAGLELSKGFGFCVKLFCKMSDKTTSHVRLLL
jgi:hypothetical protein